LLYQNTALTTLIGSANSIRPVGQVKGVADPFVVYHIATGVPTYSAAGDTGKQMVRVQFDAYSQSRATAMAVAVALRNALKNVINQTLPDGTYCYACVCDPPVDLTIIQQGTGSIETRVMVEVEVHYLG
jgi:Protein of unknown function (DUF3168)